MNCSETKTYLSQFIEGELDKNMQAEVEQHLAECPGCLREADELKNLLRELQGFEKIKAPVDFLTKIHAKQNNGHKGKISSLFSGANLRLPAQLLAASMVAVLAFYFVLQENPTDRRLEMADEIISAAKEPSRTQESRQAAVAKKQVKKEDLASQPKSPAPVKVEPLAMPTARQPQQQLPPPPGGPRIMAGSSINFNAAQPMANGNLMGAGSSAIADIAGSRPILLALRTNKNFWSAETSKTWESAGKAAMISRQKKESKAKGFELSEDAFVVKGLPSPQAEMADKEEASAEMNRPADSSQNYADQTFSKLIASVDGRIISVEKRALRDKKMPVSITAEIPAANFNKFSGRLKELGLVKPPPPEVDDSKTGLLLIKLSVIY